MTNPGRRPLRFESLNDVMPDVERLLAGHETVGRWSLGQICNHLTSALVASVEGFPETAPWAVRRTIGRAIKARLLGQGSIREGVKLAEKYAPRAGLDARAEAEALRAALRLFAGHAGPLAEHAFLGHLTPAEWDAFHRIHCAHHLSFARPVEPA